MGSIHKASVKFKEIFLFDSPKRFALEVILILAIICLFIINEKSIYIIDLFLLWAVLGFLGFFVPSSKFFYSFSAPMTGSVPEDFGIPMSLSLISRGGFIANRKITMKIEVNDLTNNKDKIIKHKESFFDYFDEFSVIYFNSIRLPLKMGGFINSQPEAGGVTLIDKKSKLLKAKSKILFNGLGDYYAVVLYKLKNDPQPHHQELKSEKWIDSVLSVSPAENYVSIRNYSMMYALTIIILLLALIQSRMITVGN